MTVTSNQASGTYPGVTRRQFLQLVGGTLGSAAVMNTMTAWGLFDTAAQMDPPDLQGNPGGTSVVVLGAGPGGSAAAYELIQRGYEVTILEAQDRVGGHALTVRKGTTIDEYGGEQQVCDWDEGLWFDAGPSRVPFYHRAFMHYAKLFNIELGDYKIIDQNAWAYAEGITGGLNGQKIRVGKMLADMAGYTSELLAKTNDPAKLDEAVSQQDQELLYDYLVHWGMISPSDFSYTGSDRDGYTAYPGVGTQGKEAEPYPLSDLLPFAAALVTALQGYLSAVPTYDWQSTLVFPAGGVETLYTRGFQPALGDRLKLNAPVQEIHQDDDQVRIVYTDPDTGQPAQLTADYCLCNIPLSVLINLKADFSSDMLDAISNVSYFMALRMGLAFKRRFWEEDDWIYGGQSFLNVPEINIIEYPDFGYHTEKGVLLGAYAFALAAGRLSALSMQDRIEFALDYGAKLHPTYREDFESGISVAWHRMPYALGAWPSYTPASRAWYYPRLLEPDGRIYLVGEHLSYVNAWMEGAFQAAWVQVEKLHERVMRSQP